MPFYTPKQLVENPEEILPKAQDLDLTVIVDDTMYIPLEKQAKRMDIAGLLLQIQRDQFDFHGDDFDFDTPLIDLNDDIQTMNEKFESILEWYDNKRAERMALKNEAVEGPQRSSDAPQTLSSSETSNDVKSSPEDA